MNRQMIAASRRVTMLVPSFQRGGLKRADRAFLRSYVRNALREISRLFFDNPERLDTAIELFQLQGEFACDLMDFVDPTMPLHEYIRRANSALIVCEQELLKARPNRTVFASAILFALFMDHPHLWQRYISHMRHSLHWFARGY